MSDVQERLGAVIERLATVTNVHRAREYDHRRAIRNGEATQLEAAVAQMEEASRQAWGALGLAPALSASESLREAA